ncbi:MAG: inorganic diphosphatase [Cellvibrionaceae bacterium]|nr:inorganic diphosphatase [Cellvibrionaceae bacterium]
MSLSDVAAGNNLPDEINVIIEIPLNGEPVKYEVDKETGALFVDRILGTAMHYPCNYGYINNTLCGDGDPADVMVMTRFGLAPGSVVRCRPVGVLRMSDESGEDAKILAVPVEKISQMNKNIKNLDDVPELLLRRITHFFEHYKDLEEGKWVKVQGWEDADAARQEILDAYQNYQQQTSS